MIISLIDSKKQLKEDTLIIGATDKGISQGISNAVDSALQHLIALGDLTGKKGEVIVAYPNDEIIKRVIICGLGKEKEITLEIIRQATAYGIKKAKALKCTAVTIDNDTFVGNAIEVELVAEAIALTSKLNQYSYETYKPKKNKSLKITIASASPKQITAAVKMGQAIGGGANFSRSLGDMPPNKLFPESLAKEAQAMCRNYPKLTIKVMKKTELQKSGFGALLAVGQGSCHPPVFIEINYRGGKTGQQPIALVGKGITFDSGGISLKPGAGMDEMRFDMCGAAAVLGIMQAAAESNLPLNLIGTISAAENLPSSTAYRPGDIVKSLSGKTIEVLNTDAEGRVVLADALTVAARKKPECIIDFATLTGAVIIALGHIASGLVTNNGELGQEIMRAGQLSGDKVWQLPLWDEYRDLIKSDIADVANICKDRSAGTITAGAFLEKFVNGIPWVHLDIAGTAWGQTNPVYGKGVTGAGVRVIMEWLLLKARKK